ncbi:hypothetical protein MVLG_01030 [Microbotryum lychnidis-dioicae p1A1 Lamole]|uniref:HSF-type DNA-binding domain-containing protein n=1 Tax=Microbotryum lychnidis-dioicae (strain p1A1 Lamole / MvSl-1064) TaxID=683840 RepID=U5H0W1_USTV1|nr:hypothetical protein MVLG_01030 [Microbotryum lychnidis-dioicae p1A1 Lamole]|eukprot:KDE08938.1 hypothetical protein MVLG_01030 [Microbotryum lychnidis-dioicae p1A1 Lamole]
MTKASRSQFIERLWDLLDNPHDADSLRWISNSAFEITCDEERARVALSPKWDFRSDDDHHSGAPARPPRCRLLRGEDPPRQAESELGARGARWRPSLQFSRALSMTRHSSGTLGSASASGSNSVAPCCHPISLYNLRRAEATSDAASDLPPSACAAEP